MEIVEYYEEEEHWSEYLVSLSDLTAEVIARKTERAKLRNKQELRYGQVEICPDNNMTKL